MSRKQPHKKTRTTATPSEVRYVMPAALSNSLRQAEALMDTKKYSEALALLTRLNQQYPRQPDLLRNMALVYQELEEDADYEATLQTLVGLTPNDDELYVPLAFAHGMNDHPALAYDIVERYLQRWPHNEEATDVRKLREMLDKELPRMLSQAGLVWPEDRGVASLHEQILIRLSTNNFLAARKLGEQLLAKRPNFAANINNISLSYFLADDLDNAIHYSQQALECAPDNIHALSDLVRYKLFQGHRDEAQGFADQLKASTAVAYNRELKIAEALTLLGDSEGMLDVYRRFLDEYEIENIEIDEKKRPSYTAEMHHFAAVAHLLKGDEPSARVCWEKALELAPDWQKASLNLEDLTKPLSERDAPWAFSLGYFISPNMFKRVLAILDLPDDSPDENQALKSLLSQHRELIPILPLLLNHGDPATRETALKMAQNTAPEVRQAILLDFCTGQSGPDNLRLEASYLLARDGLAGDSSLLMWMDGDWQEVWPIGYQIDYKPTQIPDPQIRQEMLAGIEAFRAGDAQKSVRIYEKLMEKHSSAQILNNLIAAYSALGRTDKCDSLLNELYSRYPDYVFSRTNLASRYTSEGRIEEAQKLIEPLLSRSQFQVSEFCALASTQFGIYRRRGDEEQAKKWLKMIEQVDSTYYLLPRLKDQLNRLLSETADIEPSQAEILLNTIRSGQQQKSGWMAGSGSPLWRSKRKLTGIE